MTALLIGYLVCFGACADRTHRSVTTVTSIHVVDFKTETEEVKTVL